MYPTNTWQGLPDCPLNSRTVAVRYNFAQSQFHGIRPQAVHFNWRNIPITLKTLNERNGLITEVTRATTIVMIQRKAWRERRFCAFRLLPLSHHDLVLTNCAGGGLAWEPWPPLFQRVVIC